MPHHSTHVSCELCGAHLPPTRAIRIDQAYHCDDCRKACDMVHDFDAHHPLPIRGLGLQKVMIHWNVDGVSGTSAIARPRLAYELSAFLRGGFNINQIELVH